MDELYHNLRNIPSVDKLMMEIHSQPDLAHFPHALVATIARQVTDETRKQIRQGQAADSSLPVLLERSRVLLAVMARPSLRRVINATGVVLHTNLGRAPLSQQAVQAVTDIMSGYSTLEYNVATGERGSRYAHVAAKLCALTGAEDAIAVNNNAAAVLLVLSALASGGEVIVSRGQLVEIGGSFRIPDVLRQSGATLVEVGTTNKTHLADYANAIGPNTAAIMKVHTSNYRIIGFTAQPDDKELAALAKQHKLPLIDDLGSGTLLPVTVSGCQEPIVNERLAAGIDVVTFSGDKLLGGGQAGIIAGKKQYLDMMKKHPLMRAVRIDKLSLAALEGTLIDYLAGTPERHIPAQRMLHTGLTELRIKAETMLAMLAGLEEYWWQVGLLEVQSQAGGGSLPDIDFTSYGVSIKSPVYSTQALEKRLRSWSIPIITRVQADHIVMDVRCLTNEDMAVIRDACLAIAKGREA